MKCVLAVLAVLHAASAQVPWKDLQVHCQQVFESEAPDRYPFKANIFRHPWNIDRDPQIGAVFFTDFDENRPIVRYNQAVPGCETTSDVSGDSFPSWVDSGNSREIYRRLQSHCFVVDVNQDKPFSYKSVFKVDVGITGRSTKYSKRKVAVWIPNREDYVVLKSRDELNAMCDKITDKFGTRGLGQGGLVWSRNLTEQLRKLAQYRRD